MRTENFSRCIEYWIHNDGNSGPELSANPISYHLGIQTTRSWSLLLKQGTVRCVRISRSPRRDQPPVPNHRSTRSRSNRDHPRATTFRCVNRSGDETGNSSRFRYISNRGGRAVSMSFCWRHKRASGLSPRGSYGISRGSREEGLAARVEKLQKRVRERWMRSARGLYGGARVAGMYRNEWVHFGRVYASSSLLYIYVYIYPSISPALRYAMLAPCRIERRVSRRLLMGMLSDTVNEIENFEERIV